MNISFDDLQTIIPPQFEIIKGMLVLNEPAQQKIGAYTYVFYSKSKSTLILKPNPISDNQTFNVLNGKIDLSSLLPDQSFDTTTMKKNNNSFELYLSRKVHDEDLIYIKPTDIVTFPWLAIKASNIPEPKHQRQSGKWLIFCDTDEIDSTWTLIAKATFENKLGFGSKVSTNMIPSDKKVICVYTYDANDEQDVMKVRETLRQLGFKRKLPYKTNDATLNGQYASEGKRVSKYYC